VPDSNRQPAAPSIDLQLALRQAFGHTRFRPGQEQIIESVLSGVPTLAILPTGGGKSLCYQLPALLFEGTTIVVSPLVSLMKDQVDALAARGIAASFINSSLPDRERHERQARLSRGELKLCYVAPERFRSASFLSAVAGVRVPLLAIDEAHCISSWGHDFRPDYARLAHARQALGAERVLALTATATPEVRRDIALGLGLESPRVFVAGFDRPDLFIESVAVSGDRDKLARLVRLAREKQPGIVYAATRRSVEKVAVALRAQGVQSLAYHGGMEEEERTAAQERFLREGRVMVATNAFGMGIDKADVRWVAHFDIPRSVEGWYQEIGRAGRDGRGALALLLFNFADVALQRRMIEGGRASEAHVRAVWEAARRLGQGSIEVLAKASGLAVTQVSAPVRVLESAGHLERLRGDFAITEGESELQIDFAALDRRVQRERQMLDRMVRLADTTACRRRELLRYFGDPEAPVSCTACDSCCGPAAPLPLPGDEPPAPRSPAARRSQPQPEPVLTPQEEVADPALFAALKSLRTELAREKRVPPYVVFHDSTLREICRALPLSEPEFLAMKGGGPVRFERYGERVLQLTRAAAAKRQAAALAQAPAESEPKAQTLAPPRAAAPADPSALPPQQERGEPGAATGTEP
jgi:RecQ family ATP-dependent DNA helicase